MVLYSYAYEEDIVMKGSIFTVLQEMVEESFGFECWETMIANSELPSEGIYTSAETYDDSEIFVLVSALSVHSGTPVPDLVEAFGSYLFPHLANSLPKSMMDYPDLWSFLDAVHSVIHVEVNKLYPDAVTPELIVTEKRDDAVTISYTSPRKLCFLALGLIHQAGEHFNTKVDIKHECCMHEGSDHCSLLVSRVH